MKERGGGREGGRRGRERKKGRGGKRRGTMYDLQESMSPGITAIREFRITINNRNYSFLAHFQPAL